ncbi:uncharacterized protein LOC117234225 [Bombus vosnesenskii]|uniref:Uncharacterized protein LOC117234225 n=1 Tax=Bombus vosnesenskii TaxID=207650 RepID=A0A6J3KDE7_9HYME|nr:uncharacterized protein LOC117234225 [Bombus vosnesenskii]
MFLGVSEYFQRFGVWQNVHVLDMYSVGNTTSTARIRFHIQSWYDEVEDFDSAEFGLVNFAARSNLSYIPFASSTIRQIGCGRAIYTGRSGQSTSSSTDTPIAGRTMAVGFGDRVEALVCNYGPLDRNTARELYEDGVPALCPSGTIRSSRYRALCRKCFLVEMFPPRNSRDRCRFLSLLSVLSLAMSAYSAC